MKKIIFPFLFSAFALGQAIAQFAINPQIGVSVAKLRSLEKEETNKARIGWQAGADFRIGQRLYFQPGIFLTQTATVNVVAKDSLHPEIETKFQRTDIKLRGLLGINLLYDENAKIRISAGPSYQILVAKSAKGGVLENVTLNDLENNFNSGLFNLDAGLGIDFWIITLEAGYSLGLTDAFKKFEYYESNARYGTIYFNIGIVLGNSKK